MQIELTLKWKRKAVLPAAPKRARRINWLKRMAGAVRGYQTTLQVGV